MIHTVLFLTMKCESVFSGTTRITEALYKCLSRANRNMKIYNLVQSVHFMNWILACEGIIYKTHSIVSLHSSFQGQILTIPLIVLSDRKRYGSTYV